jgi:Tfp pilus assembly protein PilO
MEELIMKFSGFLIGFVLLIGILYGVADKMYISTLQDQFKEIEKQRIVVSNKLTTAKIVHENLNHVYELVTENMVFPNQKDSITHETKFFQFVTQCINDLKLKLVAVRPIAPVTEGAITKYGYEIDMVGDFFKFGELCSKFENSRRIISLDKFDVSLEQGDDDDLDETGMKRINVTMRVTTYLIKKQEPAVAIRKE